MKFEKSKKVKAFVFLLVPFCMAQYIVLDCQLATNQCLKSADLQHRLKKIIIIKTNHTGFKGQLKSRNNIS